MAILEGTNALQSDLKAINGKVNKGKKKILKVLSVEFVRLNEDNMFYSETDPKVPGSGQRASIKSIKKDSDYESGEIKGTTPYFGYVYYGTEHIKAGGKHGKPEPFDYTYKQNEDELHDLVQKTTDDVIGGF